MVAGGKETAFEAAVKMITAPVWLPIYFALSRLPQGGRGLGEAR